MMSTSALTKKSFPNATEIDHYLANLDVDAIEAKAVADSPSDRVHKVIAIYNSVRPLIAGFAALVPGSWRTAVKLLLAALDALSADGIADSFKAGKDL
jgi:hypothetical protein